MKSPHRSRNWWTSMVVAFRRWRNNLAGKCSCDRCGRHQPDVGEIIDYAYYRDGSGGSGTFPLCQECIADLSAIEIAGWVLRSAGESYREDGKPVDVGLVLSETGVAIGEVDA